MKKLTIIIVVLMLFAYCGRPCDPFNEFRNCQIVEKNDAPVGKWFKFRYEGEITKRIYVTTYDWGKYNVGDTLK